MPLRLDSRTLRVLTIAGTSYVGRLASIAAVLMAIPVARAQLSPELFGVWMMLSGLLAFFAFADMGIGNSVLNRIAAACARGDRSELRQVIVAGYACTCGLALAVLGIWLSWAALSSSPTSVVGDIPASHRSEVLTSLHLFAVLLALSIPASLAQKVQLGMQSGHWVGLTQLGAAVGTLVAIPTVHFLGGGLAGFVLASLGMQVAANVLSGLAWWWSGAFGGQTEAIGLRRADFRWATVTSLFRTGSQFLILQLAVAFGFQSDAIVIVHRLGQAAYGDFAVVQRVFLAVSSLLLAGLAGLWPAIGEALATGNAIWVKRTLMRSYVVVLLASGVCGVALGVFMPFILSSWAGIHTPPPLALLTVLAAWTLVDALGNVSGAFLNAAGLLRAQVATALSMGLLALAGKWYLVGLVGTWGAVLATLVAYALTSVPMQIHLIRDRLRDHESTHAAQRS